MTEPAIIQESIKGIQVEINRRTSNLQTLKFCVIGDVKRWIKPVKDPLLVINKALATHREIQKLRKIRRQMKAML